MLLKTLAATMALSAGLGPQVASAFILHGGTPVVTPPTNIISTFNVTNWAGSSSPGFLRFGIPVRRGDVPSGYVLEIMQNGVQVAAQFDERTSWKVTPYTNSLKFTVCHMRDASFAANETRQYQITVVPGSWDNAGSLTTTDIINNTNYNVAFSNVVSSDGSIDPTNYTITDAGQGILTLAATIQDTAGGQGANSTVAVVTSGGQLTGLTISNTNYKQYTLPTIHFTGTFSPGGHLPTAALQVQKSTYGSGAFTLSGNALWQQLTSGVATRITKVASGLVAEGWEVWGMATDNGTSLADAHLKGVARIHIWKNPNGTIADIEHAIEVQLNWWQTTGKQRLQYDAVYKNGSTVINSYPAVIHGYGGHWITVQTALDNNICRRFWKNQIPTLTHQPDRQYWVATGLAPPLDAASAVAGSITFGSNPYNFTTYVPCASMGFPNQIDGTGGSNSRGIYSPVDALAFLSQRPADVAKSRLSSMTALSVPYHFRLETNRKRPQDGGVADMANTVPSLILTVLGGGSQLVSAYDFSYQGSNNTGMPPPAHSYWGFNSPSQYANSYSPRPHMDGTANPTGPYWTLSPASSHASNYGALYMYMLEGERHHLEAFIDLASNAATQNFGFTGSLTGMLYAGQTFWQTEAPNAPIPAWTFFAVANMRVPTNTRATGWALGLYGSAAGMCPDLDALGNPQPEKQMLIALNQQNTRYCTLQFTYMPASQLAAGVWIDGGAGSYGAIGHWHHSFIGYGGYYNHTVTEDPDALLIGNYIANLQMGLINSYPYRTVGDHTQVNPLVAGPTGGGWSTSNEFLALSAMPYYGCTCSGISSSTNVLTFSQGLEGVGASNGWFGFQAGDALYIGGLDQTGGHGYTIPSELTQGVPYYVYNPVDTGAGSGTCQLATAANYPTSGSLVTFGQNYAGPMYFGIVAAEFNQTPMANRTVGGNVSSILVGADNFCSIGHVVRTYAVMYAKSGATTAYNNSVAFLVNMINQLYGNQITQYFGWATAVPPSSGAYGFITAANDNGERPHLAMNIKDLPLAA